MNEMVKEQGKKTECAGPLAIALLEAKFGICVSGEEYREELVKNSDGLHSLMEMFLKATIALWNTGDCLIKNKQSKI